MPLVTDWLMFGITAIYVIATIFICRANISAASASREQIAESQRQFEESKRLECMPFLQMELSNEKRRADFSIELKLCDDNVNCMFGSMVKLKNIGNGTATTIIYAVENHNLSCCEVDYPPINAIMNGDTYYVMLSCRNNNTSILETTSTIVFQYDDLLGFSYEQKVILHFKGNVLLWCENDLPIYSGSVEAVH